MGPYLGQVLGYLVLVILVYELARSKSLGFMNKGLGFIPK
jgi:hypothetical protein